MGLKVHVTAYFTIIFQCFQLCELTYGATNLRLEFMHDTPTRAVGGSHETCELRVGYSVTGVS
jgi:hypothetical protein